MNEGQALEKRPQQQRHLELQTAVNELEYAIDNFQQFITELRNGPTQPQEQVTTEQPAFFEGIYTSAIARINSQSNRVDQLVAELREIILEGPL